MGFFKKAFKLGIVVLAFASLVNVAEHFQPKPIEPMTLQRRASHRIEYESQFGGRPVGYCTGTAIGPHALMTASHCNEHAKTDTIELDQAVEKFHIEKTLTDGRDHDIYLVDGPAFTNIVPYKVRPSKLGEHTYLYGSGHAVYPPRRLDGTRIYYDDPSDVDADNGIVQFTEQVIPGDSGSAVFNDDGTISAVTTYLQEGDSYLWGLASDPSTTIDFTPAFTPDQIKEATTFEPTVYTPPVKDEMDEPKSPFQFNPFFFLK